MKIFMIGFGNVGRALDAAAKTAVLANVLMGAGLTPLQIVKRGHRRRDALRRDRPEYMGH
ncbi:MAG TPA: hypothetical protein GX507_10840 [Clostridia bacterium]|nr:hypothetical protein [Clostridia bacterium]